jgi:hypothetical protein
MATTFNKVGLSVKGDDSYLSYHVARDLETNSSTFVVNSPLIWSSGLITEAADPVVTQTVVGFAVRAGQNGTSKTAEYIRAFPGIQFYANFLATAGATNTVVAADLGRSTGYDIEKNAVGPSSTNIWHVADNVASAAVCQMVSRFHDQPQPNLIDSDRWAVSDVDVRATFQLLNSALDIDAV